MIRAKITILLVWLSLVLGALSYLLLSPPKVNTDILELVSEPRFELVAKGLKNNTLRFVFSLRDSKAQSDHVKAAAAEFIENLPKDLELRKVSEYEKNLSPAYLFSEKDLGSGSIEELANKILGKLTSPLGSYYSQFLEFDPLLIVAERVLELSKEFGYRTEDNILLKEDKLALVILEQPDNLPRKAQIKLADNIERSLEDLRNKYPKLDIRWSGMLKFANSSANRMEKDLNLISTAASILTAIFVIYCFKSFYPFFLCMLTVLVGVLGGVFFVVLIKGSVHLLTIGFGCSLLGACVDYPIHYFCARYFENNKKVLTPITLGASTTLLSFAVLMFSGFNGLIEISLFALGSIIASWGTVYFLLPALEREEEFESKKDPFSKFCLLLSSFTAKNWKTIYPLLCLVCIVGALSLSFNDDIRLLQPADKQLIEDEKWIQEQTGFGLPSGFVFVGGKDEDELNNKLLKATYILKHLQKSDKLKKVEGKFVNLPSPSEQQESSRLYKFFVDEHKEELSKKLEEIGYEQKLIDRVFEIGNSFTLYPKDYDLGLYQGKYWSFLQVFGATEPESLEGVFEEYGFFYQHVKEISKIFENYRIRSFYLVLVSYFLIFSWFCLRYGVQTGCRNFMPTIFSALLSLSFLSLLGVEFNFFGLLALIIVLGLTIDYSIFYLEGESKLIPTSILLSSISTIITFGSLAFSSTPVLANFGLIVATGIFFALFLTYLPFCAK